MQVLQQKPISRTADFFSIGGNSLLAGKVMSRINSTFGSSGGFTMIFEVSWQLARLCCRSGHMQPDVPALPIFALEPTWRLACPVSVPVAAIGMHQHRETIACWPAELLRLSSMLLTVTVVPSRLAQAVSFEHHDSYMATCLFAQSCLFGVSFCVACRWSIAVLACKLRA